MRWKPVLLALAVGACGDDGATHSDAAIDTPVVTDDGMPDASQTLPMSLIDSGLCTDAACTQIASDVFAYQPQFQLWSDGATKKRWIYLPPGTQIDTSDMDYWKFPVGTKIWKEFTRDNIRVETRLIMRVGPGETNADWYYMPFVWNSTQDVATPMMNGVQDANGTLHDVPSKFQCKTCHDNTKPSRVLGFSAISLDWDNPDNAQLDLAGLVSRNLLTVAPTAPATAGDPYFPLPGGATEKAALGYLHANCGHCHNPNSSVINSTPMQLRLTVGALGALSLTPPYMTAVSHQTNVGGTTATTIVTPGQPDNSAMIERFESTNVTLHMPALGSEVMDPTGQATLRAWITNIQ